MPSNKDFKGYCIENTVGRNSNMLILSKSGSSYLNYLSNRLGLNNLRFKEELLLLKH